MLRTVHPSLAAPSTVPVRTAKAVAIASLALAVLTGCEKPAVSWVDERPVATEDPSPLSHPPMVALDSTMRDTSATAELLRLQDVLREIYARIKAGNAKPEEVTPWRP